MVGTTISHYKVLEKIGSGGMGEVFLAEDSRLDRKVDRLTERGAALSKYIDLKTLVRRKEVCYATS